MFSTSDIQQIRELGIKLSKVGEQLENFEKGFPYANIVAPANIDNRGIIHIKEREKQHYIDIFEKKRVSKKIMKFVPASGAATRMFKGLFYFSQNYTGNYKSLHKDFPEANTLIKSINKFAFYEDLDNSMREDGLNIKDCLESHNETSIVNYVLTGIGLNYAKLPKALIKFHSYQDLSRTAFEEHLIEGINYASNDRNEVFIHFTVSSEHKQLFIDKLNGIKDLYEKPYKVSLYVSFSEQKPSTDTISVQEDNSLFRDDEGKLVFRPGGHGALIENLNDCDADIVFIKNIDNIVPDRLKGQTYEYKKICGGLLIYIQERIFNYLSLLDTNIQYDSFLREIESFVESDLLETLPSSYVKSSIEEKVAFLRQKLNRPIRICGMVKNEGEPGGGPFWIEKNGNTSLQIIESSQIDHNNPEQEKVFMDSTYFNPVDLICGIKDYKQNKFNLQKFVDKETGFISTKSKDGKILKAQELPGLWNGAMANWITLFVEVPLITFNPVKTVNDLLRPEHQP